MSEQADPEKNARTTEPDTETVRGGHDKKEDVVHRGEVREHDGQQANEDDERFDAG